MSNDSETGVISTDDDRNLHTQLNVVPMLGGIYLGRDEPTPTPNFRVLYGLGAYIPKLPFFATGSRDLLPNQTMLGRTRWERVRRGPSSGNDNEGLRDMGEQGTSQRVV